MRCCICSQILQVSNSDRIQQQQLALLQMSEASVTWNAEGRNQLKSSLTLLVFGLRGPKDRPNWKCWRQHPRTASLQDGHCKVEAHLGLRAPGASILLQGTVAPPFTKVQAQRPHRVPPTVLLVDGVTGSHRFRRKVINGHLWREKSKSCHHLSPDRSYCVPPLSRQTNTSSPNSFIPSCSLAHVQSWGSIP